jgi:hypothetical protein
MILTALYVSASHRRNQNDVELTTGCSSDQDVNAVIKVHMGIRFAQSIASAIRAPTRATRLFGNGL